MSEELNNAALNNLIEGINKLNDRLSRVESALNLSDSEFQIEKRITFVEDSQNKDDDSLELTIGEFWFAKVGVIVFLLGMIFLMTQPLATIPQIVPVLIGFVLAAVLILLPLFWLKSFQYISGFLIGGGAALFYLTVLRLHFFGTLPVIESRFIEILFLLIISSFSLIISLKRSSIYLCGLSLAFFAITSLITEVPVVIFLMLTLISTVAVYFSNKFNSLGLLVYGILLTYLIHGLWFINNPFLGYPVKTVMSSQYNLIFLLLYLLIFGSRDLVQKKEKREGLEELFTTIINSFFGYGLFLFITVSAGFQHPGYIHIGASIILMLLAILHWIKNKSQYASFVYSMFAYAALSVAIVSVYNSPDFFILLCWQSIIVVSTALWFRSKFIVITNFVIFLSIVIAYLLSVNIINLSGLSFGIVALISARILNWQKERLELKTDQIRTGYLITAYFIVPFVLYMVFPENVVGLLWAGLALIYYGLSRLLRNKKYRLMAVYTLILTVLYLLVFGVISSDITYKVISFLAVSIILIVISLVYSKLRTGANIKKN